MIIWDMFDSSKIQRISQTIEEVGLSKSSFPNLASDMNLFESILAIILKFTKTKLCSETCKTRKAEAQSIYSSRKKTITV